jgi:3-phenylpropionate/trans-cinnamate dioxygenase ferredoxin reductase component
MLIGMKNHSHSRHRRTGVLVVGAGLAAQRTVETLRRGGYDDTIRLIAGERHLPYDRPPLSKQYLVGETSERSLHFRPTPWYLENDIDLVLGAQAQRLDAGSREVVLAGGERVPFAQLVIATGGEPRRLKGAGEFENVHELRTLDDARRLREALSCRPRLAVIGAGFIGQEVAATAKRLGAAVTMIESAPAPLAHLGLPLGRWFARFHRERGIDLILSARITRFRGTRRVEAIELDDGRRIECDQVVVGIGTEPATTWLSGSGLDERGVRVDERGRTAIPTVFAAGDASLHYEPLLGRHVRTEHWEAAARQGAEVARTILGQTSAGQTLPSFWSDQHGVRIQFIGHPAPGPLLIDGDLDLPDFTATFTRDGEPTGALLVGRPGALPAIRRRLQQLTENTQPERNAA